MEETEVFSGCIEPALKWEEGDEVVLQPVYMIPVEVFRTGFFSRPSYKTVTVVVDASGGRAQIIQDRDAPRVTKMEPQGIRLPANLSRRRAVMIAEAAAVTEGREGWRSLARSCHALAREEKALACWKAWIRSAGFLTDSTSGKRITLGEMLGLLLP
ncbi:MAG: hypothetical protein WBJ42_02630 [Thermovirgaceae bacterium]|nr:hypothetical protein [Synergistales bacterium]HPC75295.1 hypothetical protein [Synergistales bacterium]HRS48268.1 hypothetical protein [Thermovirgaceae bacterium]HRU90538.1 hypothetical protein [Thermovirgaceae bacterium]